VIDDNDGKLVKDSEHYPDEVGPDGKQEVIKLEDAICGHGREEI